MQGNQFKLAIFGMTSRKQLPISKVKMQGRLFSIAPSREKKELCEPAFPELIKNKVKTM